MINELVSAIRDYFDTVLQTKLLYKFEKNQLNDVSSVREEKRNRQTERDVFKM